MRHPGVEPGSQEPESWVLSITLATHSVYSTVQYIILTELSRNFKYKFRENHDKSRAKKYSERKRIHQPQSIASIFPTCYNGLVRKDKLLGLVSYLLFFANHGSTNDTDGHFMSHGK